MNLLNKTTSLSLKGRRVSHYIRLFSRTTLQLFCSVNII
nr:MAG TPA: hypothetical protein [Bacteriophage sp.]